MAQSPTQIGLIASEIARNAREEAEGESQGATVSVEDNRIDISDNDELEIFARALRVMTKNDTITYTRSRSRGSKKHRVVIHDFKVN